jgi:hypothetical protein
MISETLRSFKVPKYFNISNGLRGCYMPDNSFVVEADSIAGLHVVLEGEARYMVDAGYKGASKYNIKRLAREAWENNSYLPCVCPLKPAHTSDYSYGLFVGTCTKDEYDDYLANG